MKATRNKNRTRRNTTRLEEGGAKAEREKMSDVTTGGRQHSGLRATRGRWHINAQRRCEGEGHGGFHQTQERVEERKFSYLWDVSMLVQRSLYEPNHQGSTAGGDLTPRRNHNMKV